MAGIEEVWEVSNQRLQQKFTMQNDERSITL